MELEIRNSKLETAAALPELLRCPRCKDWKPTDEFGICRERKNGRNLYCKICIRQKINAHRAALREYKAARLKRINQARAEAEARNKSARDHLKPHDWNPADEFRKLNNASPVEISKKIAPALPLAFIRKMRRSKSSINGRILEAIRAGAHTYEQIYAIVKTPRTSGDEIGEGIAKLLLTRGLLRTEVINGTRHYFESEAPAALPKPNVNGRVKPAPTGTIKPRGVSKNGHALSFSQLGNSFARFAPVIRSASAAKLNSIREGG